LVHNYVLGNFSKKDSESWLEELLTGVRQGFPDLVNNNPTEFLNKINLTMQSNSRAATTRNRLEGSPVTKQKNVEGIFAKLSKFFE